jgi:hypothetical protein
LKLGLRLKAFVVRCLGIEPAVQAGMQITAALRTGCLPRKILVELDLFSAEYALFH